MNQQPKEHKTDCFDFKQFMATKDPQQLSAMLKLKLGDNGQRADNSAEQVPKNQVIP